MCLLMNGYVMMNGTCIIPTLPDSRLLGVENKTDNTLLFMSNLSISTFLSSTISTNVTLQRSERGIMPSFEYFQFVICIYIIKKNF